MKFQIKETPFSLLNGYHFPLIVINDEVDMLSAPYLLRLLSQNKALGTIRIHANAIIHFYRFCKEERIDFPSMMRRLINFQVGQIEALSGFMKVNQSTGELVKPETYSARMNAIKQYIFFWWDTYQSRASNNAEKLNHARNKREVMVKAFEAELKTPWNSGGKSRIGLTPELTIKFVEIINPFSDLNPFKSNWVKWRNYVLLLTLLLGGNRRGESVLLRLQDLQLQGRDKYFEIINEPNKAAPKTGHQINPSVKTKGRKIPLSEDIATIFEYYVTVQRKKFRGYLKSEFLLLSTRNGMPLSLHAVNRVTEKIVKTHPEFKGLLSPHRLRNTFHDLLYDGLDDLLSTESLGASPTMIEGQKKIIQEHAGGWTRGSRMTDHYPAGAIERKVAAAVKRLQEKIVRSPRHDEK